jgi:2-keto-4-pentenoate hydratase/2-oxohepta-3-ene-1,7-dioic acid hydratase in catechol pathway
MRLCRFDAGEGPRHGIVADGFVTDRADPSLRHPLEEVRLLAPVVPRKYLAIGLNYADHIAESRMQAPEFPVFFNKQVTCVIGPDDDVHMPRVSSLLDYEAELAIVIGREARNVTEADALSVIAGAMPFNDVSARDLQLQNPLWTSGKAIDTFAPCGPALVTLDEIDDLQTLGLRTRINGELVQEGTTSDQIFGVAELVAWLSRTMTLVPGDIIATGTPAGVGASKGRFLRSGDVVEVEVDGLGGLSSPVRAG